MHLDSSPNSSMKAMNGTLITIIWYSVTTSERVDENNKKNFKIIDD